MAKKVMTPEEQALFGELKKLSKRANQRILRLERLTGEKGLFATKELYDYLYSINGISKTGRIRVSKYFSETEMIAVIKATKNFLEDTKYSTVSSLKKEKIELEKSIGKSISWSQFSTLFTASELYKWAEEHYGSNFWKEIAPKVFTLAKSDWVSYCERLLDSDQIKDLYVLDRLNALYDYLRK